MKSIIYQEFVSGAGLGQQISVEQVVHLRHFSSTRLQPVIWVCGLNYFYFKSLASLFFAFFPGRLKMKQGISLEPFSLRVTVISSLTRLGAPMIVGMILMQQMKMARSARALMVMTMISQQSSDTPVCIAFLLCMRWLRSYSRGIQCDISKIVYMYRRHHRSLPTLQEVQTNLANCEQSNSREDCSVVDVSGHSEGRSRHDVVGQHEVDYHEECAFEEDCVFDEEEQEFEAEDVIDDLGQHEGKLFDGALDGPIVTEFAVVLSDLQPDLLNLGGWFFFVKSLEDADDVGPAVWTLNLLMIFLGVDLEDALCAE